MPTLDWNVQTWDGYEWPERGEDWSSAWGNSRAQWVSSLYARVHSFLPTARLLEIAPGFGRFTRFLIPQCKYYAGVDLSQVCINACRERFSGVEHASFFLNDGYHLPEESDFSFIFSFDSLVHADLAVFEAYIPQILSKLSPGGTAFIHHSNVAAMLDVLDKNDPVHARSKDVSAQRVAALIAQNGGHVLLQEVVNWGHAVEIDAFTLFATELRHAPKFIRNLNFMAEANIIKDVHAAYLAA
jgi:2-polyprenyl-3-methyl-5-hydroxy-6-metoxy-1,4-benzoquinol methylase